MAIVLFSFIAVLVAPLLHLSMAGHEIDLRKICGQNQAQDGLKYMANFINVTRTMHQEMRKKRFAAREGGEDPDRIYVLSQCTNDLSGDACDACFSRMITMWGNCLSFTSGRIFLDGCFMRFDNYSFFHETTSTSTDRQRICSNHTASASKQYTESATTLIHDLAKKAPRNGGNAKGRGKSIVEDGSSVHGMASCLNTLDARSCATCLANASAAVTGCLPSEEGIAFNSGCVVHYFNRPVRPSPNKNNFQNFLRSAKWAISAAACLLVMFFVGIVVGNFIRKKRRNCGHESQGLVINSLVTISMRFKYSTLQKATDDFNESHKIGQGGYGEVFKGALHDGREIAIKRLFLSGRNQTDTVCNEMDIICLAQHENLVRFLGSCFENGSLLVYEFVANGSLDRTLFDPERKKGLDWKKRQGIIEGTAKGLAYLHKQCQARIIHRDIKASNILLDWKFRPKISDFGLARFYSNDRSGSNVAIAGTIGYMAPEYLAQGRLTEKVDVYSFGVLVLEIVSGVENNNFHSEDILSTLVTTTWKHFQAKTAREIIDKSIAIDDVNEAQRIIQIGLLCTQESPLLRPDMGDVVQWLEHKNLELPDPSQPPFADECLALLSDSPLVSSSFRTYEHSISIDSCKYYDVDNNER